MGDGDRQYRKSRGFLRLVGDEDNKTFGIAIDEDSKALHLFQPADALTDWNVGAYTHPTLLIHSATTPETNYIKFYHDATNGIIDVSGSAVVTISSNTTTGVASLATNLTFTATAAISHAALEGIVLYTPETAGSGGAVPLGVRARVTLTTGCTSTLYMYAVQAQLHLENTAVLNGSMFAALRAVTTSDASPTFTGGTFAVIYVDQLIEQDMTSLDGHASMIRLANNGGGSANMDCVFEVSCPEITNLFNFSSANNVFISGAGGATGHAGTIRRIRVDDQGTTYYLLMSTAPA